MAQFDWSNGSESYDRDGGPPDGGPHSAPENPDRVQPGLNLEEASDCSGPPPFDWTDSAREVFQGLAEEELGTIDGA